MINRCERTSAAIERGIREGLHAGGQLYVSHRGRVAADTGFGLARAGVEMTRDTITLWMSSVKPVAAIAIAILLERRQLRLNDRVAIYIPEFAVNGKEPITLRHILTHTGGFRSAGSNKTIVPWDEMVAYVCASQLESDWVIGETAGYHTSGSWTILGELIRRIDGRPYEQFVREEIFLPLGMRDSFIGMPQESYDALVDRLAAEYDTSRPNRTVPAEPPKPELCALVRPGGSGRGPVRELGQFYEMLRAGGESILRRDTLTHFITAQRIGKFDKTFGHIIDWGLGFMIDSKKYGQYATLPYSFGPYASERTFGHGGARSSCAFHDPVHDVTVAWVMNGLAHDRDHDRRIRAINAAIYEDLGLAKS
jgi:CubicO group peptidase (beta-lactamase class C family)